MKILYCDDQIIVCIKPAGAVSMDEPGGMPELIRESIGNDHQVRTVHRLDSVVSGVMVYALTKEAASNLTRQMEEDTFSKEYMAVTEGYPKKDKAQLHDYLYRNRQERKTYVTDARHHNAEEAILNYQVICKQSNLSLVRVELITGRTHQIRCQFSSRKLPLYGDGKYGSSHKNVRIALWSYKLTFRHPTNGEVMTFKALPPSREPWDSFKGYTDHYENQDLEVAFKRREAISDCPYVEACGFCAYQGMAYDKQLEKKQRKNGKYFRELGKLEPVIPAEERSAYRNKTTIEFGLDKNGKLITGIFSRKARRIQRVGRCNLDHPSLGQIIKTLRMLVMEYDIPVYDAQSKSGWLKQATLRVTTGGDLMIILGGAGEPDHRINSLAKALSQTHRSIKSILLEMPGKREDGKKKNKEQRVLFGESFIEDNWMGQPFRLESNTYFPLNPHQSQKVYETVLNLANLTGQERLLDISCGSGILALAAASKAKRVLAVDASSAAIKEATERMKMMGAESCQQMIVDLPETKEEIEKDRIDNLRFINKDPKAYVEALATSKEHIDLLFIEASRGQDISGCIKAIGRLRPDKILYIGSDPEIMSRELKALTDRGYCIPKIQMVDVLPFTEQVEIISLLES